MIPRGYLICIVAALCLAPTPAKAQSSAGGAAPRIAPGAKAGVLTIFTAPGNADVALRGPMDLAGRTPIDVPPLMTGAYSVVAQGPGLSRTHGVIFLPPPGGLPFIVSEPLGVRGLNFPGVPDMMSGRGNRGFTLATSAVGAGFMAVRAHIFYRRRLDEVGNFAADRAQNEKDYRNAWMIYGLSVWGASAVDYWIRPRISLTETTPTRLTLGVPVASRGGAVWRSLLIPGAGQEFGNHRTRSVVWLTATLFSGAGYVVSDYRTRRDETDLKWAKIRADNATPSELVQRKLEFDQARRSRDESKDIRRGFVVGTLSLHALNILDATMMRLNLQAPEKPKISSIAPIMLPDGPGVGIALSF